MRLLIAVCCVTATHCAQWSSIALILFVQDTVSPHIRVNRWLHLAVVMWLIDYFPPRMLELLFFPVTQPPGPPVAQNMQCMQCVYLAKNNLTLASNSGREIHCVSMFYSFLANRLCKVCFFVKWI